MKTISISDKELVLGAKLGAVIQNEDTRANLAKDPSGFGLSDGTTIHADTADLVHLIVPANVDAQKVAANDEAYFEELGRLALGSCMYEEMPD